MKVILLVTVTTIIMAGGAFAAQTTDMITSISKKQDTITLSSGKRFHLPENIEVESLGVGDNVKVSYKIGANQRREVSAVRTLH